MTPGSAYDEEPVATDKIEHWFELSASDDTTESHQSITLIGARAQLQRLVEQRDRLMRELARARNPEVRQAAGRVKAFADRWPGAATDRIMVLTPLEPQGERLTLLHSDLRTLLAAVDPAEQPNIVTDCPHCPDGHREPTTRPWAVWVTETRVDGQPPYLMAAPTNGAHVAESDAEWLWQVIRDATARPRRPLTDEPDSGSSECTAEVSDHTCSCLTDQQTAPTDA